MLPTTTSFELVNRIHTALGERHKDAEYEGILTGSDDDTVSGILVANEPSIDAIRLAVATGKNCILCREHPFYLFGEYLAAGLADALVDDPVAKAKRQLIEDNHLIIIRLAALWDTARPKWFSNALAKELGWQPEVGAPADQWTAAFCNVPRTTLRGLAEHASARLGAKMLRMVGDPDQPVMRVAVIHGFSYPTLVLSHALEDPAVDCILTGATPEVDHCTTYIRDAITSGRSISLVEVGYEISDHPGAVEMSNWLKTVLPGMPIEVQSRPKELCWFA
ncbi:Nif3-like dinuclear metal center hexameric protein [Occallatibacter riparius]|uniref:Nif3-like dinuclear metal center hexameric protein n=1 Tax=Occallatibacter riparius TaxID=1002689 RepID=A0A9J7BRV8_9BACT|nr:Nif3-like dinuclear metal center hexameric protein [Occallatibacter riparius]UWZ84506.1 Nif3-like dinuclear metal center hexameric protein [Occallatibacter riparius]